MTTTDSESVLQTAGGISLHGYLSGSSTPPATVSFDNLDVRKP